MLPHADAKRAITKKLSLLSSPVIDHDGATDSQTPQGKLRPQTLSAIPRFQRREEPGPLELFFDLFFAANYTIFSQTQAMTSGDAIASYVGYFTVLWISWFLVAMYDVRFLSDSVLERAKKGMHLGVMVGFAVVAPQFDPSDQKVGTMRTMSLILMVSRLCLAVDYGSVLWHIRDSPKARFPFYVQMTLNILPALIYLGIVFRFDGGGSRVFVTWYVVGGLEVISTMIISNLWEVLSLTKTHLMKRMSLLTIIMLGDGIIMLAENVVKIVEGPDAWNSTIIGIVSAATFTIYVIFLVYFDWMKYTHLPAWRQQLWTGLHFPFHLSLTVFMTAFTQFIIWTKITDAESKVALVDILNSKVRPDMTSKEVYHDVEEFLKDYFEKYPPIWSDAWDTVDNAMQSILDLPNEFWSDYYHEFDSEGNYLVDEDDAASFDSSILAILSTMANSLFQTFGIDVSEDMREEAPQDQLGSDILSGDFQTKSFLEVWDRYELIFALGYIAAGLVLLFMTLLAIVSHLGPWRPWSVLRTVLMISMSIALGSISTIYYNEKRRYNYLFSPWLLPTITLVWVLVLILAHAHNFPDPRKIRQKGRGSIFKWPKAYASAGGNWLRVRGKMYEPAQDGAFVRMDERVGSQRGQTKSMGQTRLPRGDSFYDQVGNDGADYGEYRP